MGSRVFSATGHLKKTQKQTCFFLIQSVISLDKCSYMTLRYFHIRGDFCIMSQRRIFLGLSSLLYLNIRVYDEGLSLYTDVAWLHFSWVRA